MYASNRESWRGPAHQPLRSKSRSNEPVAVDRERKSVTIRPSAGLAHEGTGSHYPALRVRGGGSRMSTGQSPRGGESLSRSRRTGGQSPPSAHALSNRLSRSHSPTRTVAHSRITQPKSRSNHPTSRQQRASVRKSARESHRSRQKLSKRQQPSNVFSPEAGNFSPLKALKSPPVGYSEIYNMDLVNLRQALREERASNEGL